MWAATAPDAPFACLASEFEMLSRLFLQLRLSKPRRRPLFLQVAQVRKESTATSEYHKNRMSSSGAGPRVAVIIIIL